MAAEFHTTHPQLAYDVMACVSDGGRCRLSVTHESRYAMTTTVSL